MRRTLRLALLLCALAALAAPAALAAERMWVGFHDDPSFRWSGDRSSIVPSSARDGASIMRLLVQWNLVAPQRPAVASDPFDQAYRFDDLDEALREAQRSDIRRVLDGMVRERIDRTGTAVFTAPLNIGLGTS